MKRINLISLICFLITSSCQVNTNSNQGLLINDSVATSTNEYATKNAGYFKEKGYQVFEEYGFAIKAPCILKDVSGQVTGDFVLNCGGIENENNPSKIVFYQLMLSRLPVGYRDVPENELKSKADAILKASMKQFKNVKAISFGYEGYHGYAGDTVFKGYKQKGLMFLKENYIFALTIITNNDIESKYTKFTNCLKFINTQNVELKTNDVEPKTNDNQEQILSPIGISVVAPCQMNVGQMKGSDYYYSGAINGNDKDKAIVYKIFVTQLLQNYSSMLNSDKKTIKSNLLNYLKGKGNYKSLKLKDNWYVGYQLNYNEQGYKTKEGMILTDRFLYEFLVFSKKDVENEFNEFFRNIKYL
jgi:hypothetical protein